MNVGVALLTHLFIRT